MKKVFYCVLICVLIANVFVSTAVSQKIKMEAVGHYQKKDYCKALETFERSIAADEAMDNYALYYAAQSACQCGNQTEKAISFYKRGFQIAVDFSSYDFFANDTLNACFSQTADWKEALTDMKARKVAYEQKLKLHLDDLADSTKKVTESQLSDQGFAEKLSRRDMKTIVKTLSNFDVFPKAPVNGRWVLYTYKVSETKDVPYLVYIPKTYDPAKKTPLYIFLHGAVNRNLYAVNNVKLFETEAAFFAEPSKQNAFIVYPMANKELNWLYHQQAFEMIVGELRNVKSLYNIDDDRVYITGHSNGGSGSFWLALNKPSEIAGFSGFNFNPVCYFGNTSFSNLKNNYTFYGISGTEDGVFGYKSIDELAARLKSQGVNWTNYGIKGNHSLPLESPQDVSFVYETLSKTRRDPFVKKLQWETDNPQNGRIYWLQIDELDTERSREAWHLAPEPTSVKFTSSFDADPKPTNFYPKKSGAVVAEINDNIVRIKASCLKALTFYVVSQLVDLTKPLRIYVNDKLLFNAKVRPDKKVLIEEFIKTKDRRFLVLNKIRLESGA